ncbi:MAG: TlpA family protein disulfide reductase [Paludibacter sp.]|nr:TlpA family protein disulfide reductase [Paludibacter sp.]
MKRTVINLLLLCVCVCLSAQTIHIDCKLLPGKTGKLYWQRGGIVDSLPTVLDSKGQVTMHLPDASRKIMVTLVIDRSGMQFIAGEPDIMLICTGTPMSKQNTKITGSPENDFLYRVFDSKSKLLRKRAWIEAGLQQYDDANSQLHQLLAVEKQQALNDYKSIEEEERDSPFFAASFLRHNEFLERLFMAENKQDALLSVEVQKELEEKVDFNTLYSCAELWSSIPNYYLSMFNKIDKADKRDAFAASACKILDRLQEPYYSALLSSFITETERFSWLGAGETIVKHALKTRPWLKDATTVSPQVKRILSMVTVTERSEAPVLELTTFDGKGVVQLSPKQMKPWGKNGTLLIFYDSSCEFCTRELKQIRIHYTALQQKGIRVISIAADTDRKSFETLANEFPWSDKLFDGKGLLSENYKNYAVLGTPTLFMIDKEGKIAGRYATFEETKLLEK